MNSRSRPVTAGSSTRRASSSSSWPVWSPSITTIVFGSTPHTSVNSLREYPAQYTIRTYTHECVSTQTRTRVSCNRRACEGRLMPECGETCEGRIRVGVFFVIVVVVVVAVIVSLVFGSSRGGRGNGDGAAGGYYGSFGDGGHHDHGGDGGGWFDGGGQGGGGDGGGDGGGGGGGD